MSKKSGLKEALVLQTLYKAEGQGKKFLSTAALLQEVNARLREFSDGGLDDYPDSYVKFYTLYKLQEKDMVVQQGALNGHKRPFVLTDAGRAVAMTVRAQAPFPFSECDTSGHGESDLVPVESEMLAENEPHGSTFDFPLPSNVQPSEIENTPRIDAVLTAFTIATEHFTRLAEVMEKLITRFDVMLGEQASRARVRQQLEHALEDIR